MVDAAADMQAALRRHVTAEGQALLDQLNDVVRQLARLVLNGPQKTSIEDYRRSIAALGERKEASAVRCQRAFSPTGAPH